MINKKDACQALIEGKIIIAYFGNNGDYQYPHLATPVEVRLFGNQFCTYTHMALIKENLQKVILWRHLIRNSILLESARYVF